MAEKQVKAKKKPNWIKIRTEYETTDISYRKLAERYKIHRTTVEQRASRESWTKTKTEIMAEIQAKTRQKTGQKIIERKSDKNAYDITTALEATRLANKIMLETLQDPNQFKKHIVTHKESHSTAGVGSSSRQWVETEELDVVDTKRLQALITSLKTSAELERLLCEIVDDVTKQKLDIDKQKLELDKQKVEAGDKEAIINIVSHIPRPPKDDEDDICESE